MTRTQQLTDVLVRTISPIVLALIASAAILAALGADPLAFYADVLRLGLLNGGWQHTLTAMAPLLLIALGLIISFRARLWNLGYGGSYLLAAAVTAGTAPALFGSLPFAVALVTSLVLAGAVGASLGVVPALLKVRRHTNEVITSLMMSFIGIGLAGLLVKGAFQDSAVSIPQTQVLDLEFMLPFLPGTQVHVGVLFALAAVLVLHFVLTRTTFGVRVDMLGANPQAARHAGINTRRLTVIIFIISGGLFALAAAVDMLGLWGYLRANWNPAYGDKILPFVFLARLNPLASVPLVALYALLATGGTIAAGRAGISVDILLVIVALILFFMMVIEYLGTRVNLGKRYVPSLMMVGAK